MTTKVTMPQMGESISEGTLTKWLKKVGETVVRDEPLFEISTDKVDSEIPSPASGVLTAILVPEDKIVQVNTVLAIINGALAEESQAVPDASVVQNTLQEIPVEAVTAKIEPSAVQQESPKKEIVETPVIEHEQPSIAPSIVRFSDIRTSPLVRKLARENNVNLSEIQGTGLEGRITKEDILNYIAQRSPSVPIQAPPALSEQPASREIKIVEQAMPSESIPQAPPAEPTVKSVQLAAELPRFVGETETVPMTPMRKAIAEHMVFSKRTSAHVNTVFEVDMNSIVQLRERYKAEFENREGIPLTYTPFFVKALIDTVREFPSFNSSVSGESIVYKKPINVGVAVALETGLIVPVIKNAHLKSFTGLALTIEDLAKRARTKRLKPDDIQDGTITITNPGSFGALFSTPIINQPQVAILGVGGIEKRPVVINDAIAIRSMVCLSLTFDHRVIDGAVADRFMAKLKEKLQSWSQWID